jgi:cytochrome c oxidase subunit II
MTRHALWFRMFGSAAAALALGGCEGVQSALAPQGPEAARIALLTWVLTAGAAVILVGVIVLTAMAMFGRGARRPGWLASDAVVIGGGVIFPVVTLSVLLVCGLLVMRADSASTAGQGEAIRIAVVGERWWWRVFYRDAERRRIESANELRIPVGQPIAIELTTTDVIHSFWVPSLAGKLDMIPGRTNVLRLSADRAGISRGQCAEYCGGAHALMSFHVVAMPQAEYQRWRAREAGPAEPPGDAQAQQGQLLFMASGCGACHAIRGTAAAGRIGPDLTHVGGRMSLAAATLPNNEAAIARWIRDNQHIKPQNLMPPFGIFNETELMALSRYLAGLR